MNSLTFENLQSVLFLGAHPDDIEIGCGATVLKLLRPSTEIHWVVFSGDSVRRTEAEKSAAAWLSPFKNSNIQVLSYEDGFFPMHADSIKRTFGAIREQIQPDLVFTHHLMDRHQDHRLLAELTWQTFRNHTILEYEIPKFEGDLGHPNFFVTVDEGQLNQKIDLLLQFHQSQTCKSWFDRDLFRGHARLRGAECNARFAEAFHARKLVAL